MLKISSGLMVLAIALALPLASGCKSNVEKACANAEKLYEKADKKFDDDCVKEMEKDKEKCGDGFDDAVECMIEADEAKGIKKCWKKHCKKK